MFNWLVHSKTRLKMMKLFFKDPTAPLYGLEIAQTLKASPGTTHRELNALLKQGVITKKKEGALVMYRLNQSHPYFYELKKAIFPKKKTNRVLFVSDIHLSVDTSADLIEDLFLLMEYAEESASELVFVGDMIEMLEGCVFQTYLLHKPLFDRLTSLSRDLKVTVLPGNHDVFFELLCQEGTAGTFLGAPLHFAQQYTNESMNIFAAHGHQFEDLSAIKPSRKSASQGYKITKVLDGIKKGSENPHLQQLKDVAEYADQAYSYAQNAKKYKAQTTKALQNAAEELITDHHYSYIVMGHTHKAAMKEIEHGLYFNCGSWKSEKKRQFVEIDHEGGALVSIDDLR